ncbi:MAG: hypothetical protein ACFFCS_09740 [Candidatus Hodarchaeota archaeon]
MKKPFTLDIENVLSSNLIHIVPTELLRIVQFILHARLNGGF